MSSGFLGQLAADAAAARAAAEEAAELVTGKRRREDTNALYRYNCNRSG